MFGIILLVIIIVLLVKHKKKKDQNKVASGAYDADIDAFMSFVGRVRPHVDELGTRVIVISTHLFEIDGNVDSSSALMSLKMRDGTNDELAESLGMDVTIVGGKKYYELVQKKGFSTGIKREIVKQLGARLADKYPDDAITVDEQVPAVFVSVELAKNMQLFKGME